MRALARMVALLALLPAAASAQSTTYEQMQAFSGVLGHVRLNYVDSVDLRTVMQGSIRGMLAALDPHSYYMSREDFDLRLRWSSGELGSPGLMVDAGASAGTVVVTGVEPGSPAARAGIQVGDRLVRLGELATQGLGVHAVQTALLGDKGSKVRLSLERGSPLLPDTFAVTVKRAAFERRAVAVARMAGPGTGYVRLAEFTTDAPEELTRAIRKLDPKRLVLDLRGNGGGDLRALTWIAAAFLPEGAPIYATVGRKAGGQQVAAPERGAFVDLPLVLLIDAGTASAAEILAGTLQDNDRAVVVGRRSFGKALVQSSLPLPNGDVVWLTTARIATPSGRIIQRPYQGVYVSQYLDRAGRGSESEDTTRVYRTKGGRAVRGGGGIRPEVPAPAPADLPTWFAAAVEGGVDTAVANAAAVALPADDAARGKWMTDSTAWESRVLEPFLEQARKRLSVGLAPQPDVRARLARVLGAAVAHARWGQDAADEFQVRNDPDIRVALAQVVRDSL